MEIQQIEKRNRRLKAFFEAKGISVKIIGDIHKPAVIANDDTCLSCYVANFNLILTDMPFQGKLLFDIKLTDVISTDRDEAFFEWYSNAVHRKVYKVIARINTDSLGNLYLTGFNSDESNNLVPVFSEANPKIYFTEEKAQDIADRYSTENITLIVI